MENNIDKLQLDISVTGNAASSAKDINNLATAISNLQNKVGKSLEFTGIKELTSDIKDVTVSLKDLSASALLKIADDKEIAKGKKLSELLGEIKFKYDDIIKSGGKLTEKQSKELEAANRGILELATSAREDVIIKPPKIKVKKPPVEKEPKVEQPKAKKQKEVKPPQVKKQKEVKPPQVKKGEWRRTRYGGFIREDKIKKELSQEIESSKKVSNNQKKGLSYAIKRIVLFRAIREIIQKISTSVIEGVNAIAAVSPEANKLLSKVSSDLMVIKASIGLVSSTLLQSLAPILDKITNLIVQFANNVSYASAKLNGQKTYVSINTKAWQKYKKAIDGALLSFDTFTVLNSQNILQDFLTTKSINDTTGLSENPEKYLYGVQSIKNSVKLLFDILENVARILEHIKNIIAPIGIFDFNPIEVGLASINNLLKPREKVLGYIDTAIQNIIKGFKKLFGIKDTDGKYLAGGAIVDSSGKPVKNTLTDEAKAKIKSKASSQFGFIGWAIGKLMGLFANGGIMEGAGTLYSLAGERGAEIVAQGSQGTGVANVKQIAEAVYQGQMRAFIDYNAARGDMSGMSFDVDGYRLGQMVARNDGFINAVRQKNPTLNFR